MSWKVWFRHAFAIESADDFDPTPPQRAIAERLCREVVRRRMTTPALMALEMSRPLNNLGAQTLHFFAPMISAITDAQGHRHLAEFLEHRGSIDYLTRQLEACEAEATAPTTETTAATTNDAP